MPPSPPTAQAWVAPAAEMSNSASVHSNRFRQRSLSKRVDWPFPAYAPGRPDVRRVGGRHPVEFLLRLVLPAPGRAVEEEHRAANMLGPRRRRAMSRPPRRARHRRPPRLSASRRPGARRASPRTPRRRSTRRSCPPCPRPPPIRARGPSRTCPGGVSRPGAGAPRPNR